MIKPSGIPAIEPTPDIAEEAIRRLVHTFYDRVLHDCELAPIFRHALADRWDAHLATMVDFWASIAFRSGRYNGRPQVAHRGLGLSELHFQRWLSLFETTAREIFAPDAAAFFIDRAHRIADSLQIGLNLGPKSLRLPQARSLPGANDRPASVTMPTPNNDQPLQEMRMARWSRN